MLDILLGTLWFLLPAGIANMAPVLFKWVPILNYPVDFGLKVRGEPLFGKNKTYRGFLFGIIAAIVVVYFQSLYYLNFTQYSIIPYAELNSIILGFLFGFGALLGDVVESFFKRQVGIKAGDTWFPFDQIDWILGALIFVSFYVHIPWLYIASSIVLFGILHPIINLIGYFLGIKKNKF